MDCPRCRHSNPPQANFCTECGAGLRATCARCGTELPPAAKFCLECGARVGGEPSAAAGAPPVPEHLAAKIRTARGRLEGERRQVTVLFADVAGFTALAERLDPEQVHGIMDRCFHLLADEVHRYEGTVNKFTGDGIMALFGAPIAHEDAPERAVRAGLGMQAALAAFGDELRREQGIDFRMRIGVHTGPVVVGGIGDDLHMDYTAVGDTTNLASRLETAATPGTVLVSERTAKLVAGRFTTRPVGPLQLKGKSRPVAAHEVVRALPRVPLLPVSERGLTPLVGRAAELAQLETLFAHAAAGRGQVAFVVGEAGIGKSRVIHEFRRRVAAPEVTWLEGRCVSFGRQFPFLPLIDVVNGRCGIEESDDERTIVEKVRRTLAALGPGLAAAEPYLHALLAVDPGDPAIEAIEPSARRFAIFDAVKRVVLATASRGPLVLLVEDLHWIDPASEEFLTFIVDALVATRILLLCTYRQGYRPPFGERTYFARLALQPLSAKESSDMAAAVLDARDFPPEIRRLVAAKAEGNPFYVEEVTKTLVETGALARANGGYMLAKPVSEIVIPDTIQDVIMARIDRLGDAPKRAIQIASVIGREFAVRLLQRATDFGEHLERLVGELRALELIYEKSALPELAYMFKHALTHDVAYESLLVQRRRELHLAVGRAIEELYADRLAEHWETLAHHFDRGEDWPRAFDYLVRAGTKALATFANREALAFFGRALEVAPRVQAADERLCEIQRSMGWAHFRLNDFAEAEAAFRRALARVGPDGPHARLMADLAATLLWEHEFEAASRTAEEAIAAARTAGDLEAEAGGFYALGLVATARGNLEEGERHYTRVEGLCRSARLWSRLHEARAFRAVVANWRGDYAEAIREMEDAMGQLKAANQLFEVVTLCSTFAITLGGAGEYVRALAVAAEGIALGESIGDRVWRARSWNTRGWILAEVGAHNAAEEANRRCLEIATQLGPLHIAPELIGNAEGNLVDLALARGDLAGAAPHLAKLAGLVDDPRNEWMTWRYGMRYRLVAAELALAHGDLARARRLVEACLATAERTRSRRYIVRGTRTLAACHEAGGEPEVAERLLARAVADARALGNPPQLWHALIAHARVLGALGRRDEAGRAGREALATMESVARALPEDMRGPFAACPARVRLGELLG